MENESPGKALRQWVKKADLPNLLPKGAAGRIAATLGKSEPVVRQVLYGQYINREILLEVVAEMEGASEKAVDLRELLAQMPEGVAA